MKIQSAVEEYLVEIEVRKYTPKTIRSYRCNLNLFLRFCAEKLHVETVKALTPAVVRQFSRCMSEAGRKGTYEYQGDNVLIARINLLLTFTDYYEERWERRPDDKLLRQMANKIAWNIWQMDGLKDTVPLGKPYEEFRQITLFDLFGDMGDEKNDEPEAVPCRIFDWRSKNSILFKNLKEM